MASSLNENIKLGIFDTLHDFWKERKISKNDEEDDDDEPMDESKQVLMRQTLVNFIGSYLGIKVYKSVDTGKNINDFLKNLSNQNITSVTSNYERNVLKYYEEISILRDFSRTKESLRYGDIIDSYVAAGGVAANNILLQKYINSNGTNYVLELSCGDHKTYTSFGKIQKNTTYMGYIANFILNYYFPGITSTQYNAYFTFDAKPGVVAKTFRDINEVYQLVTPANIADSAVTTFKALNNRNVYFFPGGSEMAFTSNYYTTSSVELKFIKSSKGFDVKNQFGFSLGVKAGRISKNFDFSSSQKQGPSVNYLVDLMLEGVSAKPNVNSIINISELGGKNFKQLVTKGLLFDLKRGGDYEQVNAASYAQRDRMPTILSTIDILCSLYARTIGQNCVWHNGEKMILYRFPSVQIDPNLLRFNSTKYKAIDLIQELEIIKKLNQNGLQKDIQTFLQKLIDFYNNGLYIDNIRKKGITPMDSEIVATYLIKMRIIDIMFGLSQILNIISQFTGSDVIQELKHVQVIQNDKLSTDTIEQHIGLLKNFTKSNNMSQGFQNVLALITEYEKLPRLSFLINKIKSILDLTPNQVKLLLTGENPIGLDYVFYSTDLSIPSLSFYKFNYTGNCQELKFSNKLYSTIFNILNKFERMVNSASSRSKNLYDKLHKMDYFTFTNTLYQSYFIPGIAEQVYNVIQPQSVTKPTQSPTSDAACEFWWKNLKTVLGSKLAELQQRLPPSNYKALLSQTPPTQLPTQLPTQARLQFQRGGSKYKLQKGGNPDLVQIYNLSDLLRLISGTAAQFIEGFISENLIGQQSSETYDINNLPSIDVLIPQLMTNYNMCRETMDEILFLFANGLMTLQNEEDEGYIYEPTAPEFELLLCLSHFMTSSFTSNEIDYYYLSANSYYYGSFMQQLKKTSTGRGTGLNLTRINDIHTVYNTSVTTSGHLIHAEILNLLVLTMIDNTMQNIRGNPNPKQGYFMSILTNNNIPSVGFDNPTSWNKLMDYFYAYLYIFSKTTNNPANFAASIQTIRSLSGGKKNKKSKYKTIKYKNKRNKTIKHK